jgi:TonB-dependent starch-binding outer membrane protein SusC
MKKICRSFLLSQLKLSHKTLLTMKVSFILTLITTLNVSAVLHSQDVKLNLNVKDKSLIEVIRFIEKQSNYRFFFSDNYQDLNSLVSLDVKDKNISEVLSSLLDKKAITYKVLENNIVVITPNNLQQQKITGTITDSNNGEPLPGVSIQVEGTNTGTVSDMSGKYSIDVPSPSSVLVFSYVGYLSEKIVVSSQTAIDVKLALDVKKLDEIIVVGYGTQKKSDLTGSVGIVNASQMKEYSTNDISQLLQGRVAGVAVTSDGEAGAAPTVRIRGFSTLGNSDQSPLYVVDGVRIDGVRDFNPNDIESMTILKDASAGAVYGASAANGVVLITTKHGKKNSAMKMEYSGYFGWNKVTQRVSVTGREDYQTLQNEMLTNAGLPLYPGNDPTSSSYITNINTDWQKEAYKIGTQQDHSLNVSGGGISSTYSLSLDYFQSDGTFVGSGPNYDRYSGRMTSETEKGIFKIGESLYITHSFQDGLTATSDWLSGGRPPMVVDLVTASPIVPVYDTANLGGFGGAPLDGSQGVSANVVGLNTLIKNTTEVDRYLGNAWGEVKLLEGLKYKINLSYNRTFCRDIKFEPLYNMGYFINNTESSKLYDNDRTYTKGLVENTLTYDQAFGKHSLSLLAGQMYESNRYDFKGAYADGLTEPYFVVLNSGTDQSCSGYYWKWASTSYLGRLNYNFDEKYFLQATVRADASSKFAKKNRWGTFPSMALAWKLNKENFITVPSFISELKLRVSYGQLGNDNIDPYLYSTTVNQSIPYNFNGTKVTGGAQTLAVDQSIKWETKTKTNIGFDAAFFRGAFEWTADYYNDKSTDILVAISIPGTSGAVNNTSFMTNAASMRNTGFETSLTYHKATGDFTFDITGNACTLKNKILNLGANNTYLDGSASRTQIGRSLGDFYGYKVEGIFQSADEINTVTTTNANYDPTKHAFQASSTSPGDFKFKDLNDDGVITSDDRTFLGRGIPKIYYGMNFKAWYKGFDITINASGSGGNKINSRMYAALMHCTDYTNYSTEMLKRWTPDHHSDIYPRLCEYDPNSNGRMSDRKGWLQDGTYLRINTISLGYTISDKLIKNVSSLRLYATCQNPYIFKYYTGFNPDYTTGVLNPGYDNGSYPKPRTVMFGVQASF